MADDFIHDHQRSAETAGIATLPYARISDPLVSQGPERVWSIVDGAIDDVVAALTKAPTRNGGAHGIELRTDPWFTFRGRDQLEAFKAMNATLLEWQYSDGLPLIPATKAEVERMLAGTTRDRDEVIGVLEPGGGIATVEKIAVNAVMAGCEPRHLPILIAAVECLADHNMDLREKAISTGPAAPFIMVNGPARKLAGLNTGICMLGPGAPSHSNTVIGRALRLCMMNIGHTYPAISDMDTIGSPNKYSMCLAENEENSPWQPYHVLHGLPPGSSAVTVGFVYGLSDLTDYHSTDPETAIRKFATLTKHMGNTSTGFWLAGNRSDPRYGNREQEHHYVFLAPQHARVFAQSGWKQKDISAGLYREGRIPFGFLSSRLEHSAIRSAHPELAWLWDSPDTLVPVLESAECFDVIVAGSPGSNRSSFSWGQGGPVTKHVREEDLKL
ncbi:MAG: hypothetical protein KGJ98_00110 [Chloroflexota bacterium]|nr:hypothetical protein [Chloroflexota bacterium]